MPPEALTAPPPAAPAAAAPAPASAPEPAAIPLGTRAPSSEIGRPGLASFQRGLSKLTGDEPAPADKPDEIADETPDEPEVKAQPKPEATKVEAKVEPKAPVKVVEPAKPLKAASLREALDQTKKQASEWKSKYEALQKEMATPKEDPEKKGLTEKLTAAEKRRQDVEDRLRFADYKLHPEYQEKYRQPLEKAYGEGIGITKEFEFKLPDTADELGTKIPGVTRMGTKEDWDEFVQMDNARANKFAHEHFGYNAPELINMRREVQKLAKADAEALDTFQKQGAEKQKAEREMSEKKSTEFSNQFESEVKAAQNHADYKDWFNAKEGDTVGSELLNKGSKIAEKAFGITKNMSPEEKDAFGKMTDAEKVQLYAATYNRTRAFSYVNHLRKQETARADAAEAKLKEFEDSEPKTTGATGRRETAKPKTGKENFAEQLNRLAGGG